MKYQNTTLISSIALAFAITPSISYADDASTTKVDSENVEIHMPVPDVPAFTGLGISPKEISRPTDAKSFNAALINGVDNNGNLQTGLALDTNPFRIFAGDQLTIQDYQKNSDSFSLVRTLYRTRVSFATTKGSDTNDKAVRIGTGFSITPYDAGDPRLDKTFTECVFAALDNYQISDWYRNEFYDEIKARLTKINNEKDKPNPDISKIVKFDREIAALKASAKLKSDKIRPDCQKRSSARNWNNSAWSIGVAPIFISENGNTNDIDFDTASFWTTFNYGFGGVPGLDSSSELSMSVRYTPEQKLPNAAAAGTFLTQNTFVAGAQLRVALLREKSSAPINLMALSKEERDDKKAKAPAPTLILSMEADYINADRKNNLPDDTSYRYSLGLDWRIPESDNTYIAFSLGGTSDEDANNANSGFALVNLKKDF